MLFSFGGWILVPIVICYSGTPLDGLCRRYLWMTLFLYNQGLLFFLDTKEERGESRRSVKNDSEEKNTKLQSCGISSYHPVISSASQLSLDSLTGTVGPLGQAISSDQHANRLLLYSILNTSFGYSKPQVSDAHGMVVLLTDCSASHLVSQRASTRPIHIRQAHRSHYNIPQNLQRKP
ncbi:uncharacterized protein CLUP02_01047 [Colletotrichum lupini]|uniref:Uncharacterized protein n=1 Tax=Colletotrichum lupini TaxID=145971 RepID=A0A9Q8SBK1_9PEZI|nr:uncharacterized protein CLUP02_01047 [Colletotrichum lupini]UQC74397.1 hypothetical protein CLUP02_01047 [Colletotrichum lupini]